MSEAKSSETPKAKRSDAEDAAVWERFAGRPGEKMQKSQLSIACGSLAAAPDGFGLHMRQIIPPDANCAERC